MLAHLCAHVVNSYAKEPHTAAEFLPPWYERPAQTPEQMIDVFKGVMRGNRR